VTLRLRLTALYTLLFGACGAILLALSSWLVHRQVQRTLPSGYADHALARLDTHFAIALGGTLLMAVALGYFVAGRALAPVRRVTGLARRVTQERMDERIDMRGPEDELHELADTVDAMLDRLATAFDGQRRFVANASHELRTPLTVIRAEVEVTLADPDAGADDLRRMGHAVLDAADRTQALLNSLMVLARSQQAVPRGERVDLARAAHAAERATAAESAAEGVGVDLDLRPAPLTGDRPLVERLVANLVENAVRHNEPGGSVWVTTRPGLIRVENTGPKISPDDVHRLAEPFERLRRDCQGPGAGLGLSIVRAVADAHGARLELEPRTGGGLVAAVRFPSDPPLGIPRGSGRAVAPERHADSRVRLDRPLLSRVRGALQVGVDAQQAVDGDRHHRGTRAQRADEDRSH
jgi:signal transduction histidine kinase